MSLLLIFAGVDGTVVTPPTPPTQAYPSPFVDTRHNRFPVDWWVPLEDTWVPPYEEN